LPFGVAAIGVIEALEQHGIPIHCLAGVSMGSIIGLLYAYGYSTAQITSHFEGFFKRRSLVSVLLRDVRLSRAGFVQGRGIMNALERLVRPTVTFEELRIPFAVPAADLATGQEIVFRKGPVLPAIRASISMPGIFVPVAWGGTFLVDGAVITPIPVHLLPALGADIAIPMRAVRECGTVERQRFVDSRDDAGAPHGHAPDLVRLMWRSLSLIMQDRYADTLMSRYPLAIRPEVPFDYAGSPDKLQEIIAIGREETVKHIPAIRAAMTSKRPAAARVDGEQPPPSVRVQAEPPASLSAPARVGGNGRGARRSDRRRLMR
jgi:NTE family protein